MIQLRPKEEVWDGKKRDEIPRRQIEENRPMQAEPASGKYWLIAGGFLLFYFIRSWLTYLKYKPAHPDISFLSVAGIGLGSPALFFCSFYFIRRQMLKSIIELNGLKMIFANIASAAIAVFLTMLVMFSIGQKLF